MVNLCGWSYYVVYLFVISLFLLTGLINLQLSVSDIIFLFVSPLIIAPTDSVCVYRTKNGKSKKRGSFCWFAGWLAGWSP